MNKLRIIIAQEFRMTAATKSFAIMTLVGPFLIAGVAILPGLLAQRQGEVDDDTRIAVVGGTSELFDVLEGTLATTPVRPVRYRSEEEARVAAGNEDVRGVLVVPEDYINAESVRYISRTGTDMQVASILETTLGAVVTRERIEDAGLNPEEVTALTRRPRLQMQRLSSDADSGSDDTFAIFLTALMFVMMIYMTVLLYGQMIGRSVLTEKQANTKEIMLSSVRSSELLFGKIFGKGLAGLLQYTVWIGIAVVVITFVGPRFDIQMPSGLTTHNLRYLLMFFVLAFFLYSAGFAAVGAASQDEQQFGQLCMPLIMFLVIPLILISPIFQNPDSTLSAVLSYVPFTSPIIMLVRVLVGNPSTWEVAISVAILVVSIGTAGVGAARIFRVGILLSGSSGSWKKMLRWLRA